MSKRTRLIITTVVLFLGAVLCSFLISWLEPQIETVNAAYVKEHTGKPGFLLVDVREEDVFNGTSPARSTSPVPNWISRMRRRHCKRLV